MLLYLYWQMFLRNIYIYVYEDVDDEREEVKRVWVLRRNGGSRVMNLKTTILLAASCIKVRKTFCYYYYYYYYQRHQVADDHQAAMQLLFSSTLLLFLFLFIFPKTESKWSRSVNSCVVVVVVQVWLDIARTSEPLELEGQWIIAVSRKLSANDHESRLHFLFPCTLESIWVSYAKVDRQSNLFK